MVRLWYGHQDSRIEYYTRIVQRKLGDQSTRLRCAQSI